MVGRLPAALDQEGQAVPGVVAVVEGRGVAEMDPEKLLEAQVVLAEAAVVANEEDGQADVGVATKKLVDKSVGNQELLRIGPVEGQHEAALGGLLATP